VKTLGGRFLETKELLESGLKSVGKNVRVHSNANLYGLENIELGDNCRIDDFALIIATGKLVIGRHVSVHPYCFLGAKYGIEIDDYSTLAPGVKIFSSSDDYGGEFLTGPTVDFEKTGGKRGMVSLGRHVIVGSGTVILPSVNLREGSSVGALSLVNKDLDPWSIYAGIPAKRLRDRKRDLLTLEKDLMS